jgi:short-subunit dehydrogenase
VLVSRTLSKLNNVDAEVKNKTSAETKVIVADFSSEKATNPEFYKEILS